MSITIGELIRRAMDARLAEAHVALPAKVKSYDPATQTCSVSLQVQHVLADPDGAELVESYPVIPNVPVGFPRGGGFAMTFPLAVGDFVTVVFCERSIAKWRATGIESDPGELAMHGFSGAWAYPGLYPDTAPLAEASATDFVVGKDGGSLVRIKPDGTIELGATGTAVDFVALAAAVQTQLTALKTAITSAAVVAGDGGASFKAAILASLAAWPGSVAATKVKAE